MCCSTLIATPSDKMVHQSVRLFKQRWKGLMRPMKLKSKVRMSSKVTGKAPCSQEMTALMSCWKQNDFNDLSCVQEVTQFLECSQQVRASKITVEQQGDDGEYGATSDSWNRFPVEDVNRQLKKFPTK